MFRRLSTIYYRRRESCSSKMMNNMVWAINKLSILLQVCLKVIVILSVYKIRPTKETNEEEHDYCNGVIALYSAIMCYHLPMMYTLKFMDTVFQYITFIISSTLFSIFWWTLTPTLFHQFVFAKVYLSSACLNCLKLLIYILNENRKNKLNWGDKSSAVILPVSNRIHGPKSKVPYAHPVINSSAPNVDSSVNVSISV